ncbi:MAG: hypothetical protein ABW328_18900 [Ilumatobacteraceae bacterium]
MKRLFGVLLASAIVLVPSVGRAGGWAVASLDPLPPIEAGHDATIGFQLLQHGVTPVVADEWGASDIGVAVRSAAATWFVEATPGSTPGHYEATIAVPPDVTTLSVNVEMRNGLVLAEQWVEIPVGVGGTAAGATTSSDAWLPTWTVPLFALAAVTCGWMIVLDARSRRTGITA